MMAASPFCITAKALSVSDFGLFYSGFYYNGWLAALHVNQAGYLSGNTDRFVWRGIDRLSPVWRAHHMRKVNFSLVSILLLSKCITRSVLVR
jgi:hypothetical protein